jgi:hypothetical protein
MTSGTRTPAFEHGDAYCRLQKTIGIVSRLFFTMKGDIVLDRPNWA